MVQDRWETLKVVTAVDHGIIVGLPPLQLLIFVNSCREPGKWTMPGGRVLDFGAGSPPKGYRRRPKVPSGGLEHYRRVAKSRRELGLDTDGLSRYESSLVIVVLSGMPSAQRIIKATLGVNRVITPKSSHRRSGFGTSIRLTHPGLSRSQVGLFAHFKAVRRAGSERRADSSVPSGVGEGYLKEELSLVEKGPGRT